jgi:hypothetical protein
LAAINCDALFFLLVILGVEFSIMFAKVVPLPLEPHHSHFLLSYFSDRALHFCLGWPQILLPTASHIAGTQVHAITPGLVWGIIKFLPKLAPSMILLIFASQVAEMTSMNHCIRPLVLSDKIHEM